MGLSKLIAVNFDTQTVSARELHKALEVKYDFTRWVNSNFKEFAENVDFFGGSHRCEGQSIRRKANHR